MSLLSHFRLFVHSLELVSYDYLLGLKEIGDFDADVDADVDVVGLDVLLVVDEDELLAFDVGVICLVNCLNENYVIPQSVES